MLCDVASICCKDFDYIASIYDGADTDRQYPNAHIHVQFSTQTFHVSIYRPYLLYVNKRTAIHDSNMGHYQKMEQSRKAKRKKLVVNIFFFF